MAGIPGERNQMPLFLFDDFEFYRGLVGNLVQWSAATPPRAGGLADRDLGLAESGCYGLRWAMGIGAAAQPSGKSSRSKWFEYRLEPSTDHTGFRLQAWNRLPWTKPTLAISTRDVGLVTAGAKGNIQRPLLWLQLSEPAYREPVVVDVQSPTAERITIQVSHPVRLRLNYAALRPEFEEVRPPMLRLRRDDEPLHPLPGSDSQVLLWGNGDLEWSAEAGRYELLRR